jgi:hypothetical protein
MDNLSSKISGGAKRASKRSSKRVSKRSSKRSSTTKRSSKRKSSKKMSGGAKRKSKRSSKRKSSKKMSGGAKRSSKTTKRSSKRKSNKKMSGGAKRKSRKSKKMMKGGDDLSDNDKLAVKNLDIIINNTNLINKCPTHTETFGNLFASQTKCELVFVNMLDKVQLMKLLMDKLPKEVAATISQKDIVAIDNMINNGEVSSDVAAKYSSVLNIIFDKLYSMENLLRLASLAKPEINDAINNNKEKNQQMLENIKNIFRAHFGLKESSPKQKEVAKQIMLLIKFLNSLPENKPNISDDMYTSFNKMGVLRLDELFKNFSASQTGGNRIQKGGEGGFTILACILFLPLCIIGAMLLVNSKTSERERIRPSGYYL